MIRKIAIGVAVALGISAILYLSGLLAQIMEGRDFLLRGPFMDSAALPPIRAGPLECLRVAFTPRGLALSLIVTVAAAALMLYLRFGRGRGTDDGRGFQVSKTGTYGTAGWMSEKEMKKVLELTSPAAARGTILGAIGNSVVSLPEKSHINRHIAVLGASGTMKSRAFVRNCVFSCVQRSESLILSDPKSEMYNDLSRFLRENGYTVKVFNLLSPKHGDSWNCMARLRGDTLLAQILADVIISNTSLGDSDRFWDSGELNLLKALILLVDLDPNRTPDEKNLAAVYHLLTRNDEKRLQAMFDRLPIEHPAKAPYMLFSQASDTVKSGIILGLGTRLQVLQNESVSEIISHDGIDMTEPGKRKCAYFLIMSDQNGALDFLSALFFSFLFIELVGYADGTPNGRCAVPVNLILDEMNNIGRAGIPDFSKKLSTIRSRYINVYMVVQNLSQLKNRYPNDQWSELLGNCDTQLMLGCTDEITAEYVSGRSGMMTVVVNSTMTTRQTMAVAQMIPQYRQSESVGKRPVLTADEVLRLPNEEILVMIRGQKILKLDKYDYTRHPFAKLLKPTHISRYRPKRRGARRLPPLPLNGHFPDKKPPLPDFQPAGADFYSNLVSPDDY